MFMTTKSEMTLGENDHVERILRDRIATHELSPGSKLGEAALAKEFGISRSRVREILNVLAQKELVKRIPNRGAVVAKMDAEQLSQIYDLFEVLEGLTARLACMNSQPSDWDELSELFGKPMEEAVADGDVGALFSAVGCYRETALRLARNDFLSQTLNGIYDRTQMIIRRTLILPGRAKLSLEEHQMIIAAMRRGDVEAAERCKLNNMKSARDAINKYIDFVL